MGNRFPIFIILILIAIAAIVLYSQQAGKQTDISSYITNTTCDADTPCPEGQECYGGVSESGPICVKPGFTDAFCKQCPIFKKCMVLEMYPPSIHCG